MSFFFCMFYSCQNSLPHPNKRAPIKTHLWIQLDETCPNLFITYAPLDHFKLLEYFKSYSIKLFDAGLQCKFIGKFLDWFSDCNSFFSCFNKFHFSNHDLPNPISLHCNMYQHRRPEDSTFKKPQQNTKPHYQELFREESCT